jgi:glutathione synthase/RimK-type ligase-like ATP-grasp enzyme
MLGIVTDESHRDFVEDDRLLVAALERHGVSVLPVVWGELPAGFLPERLLLRTPWDFVERPDAFLRWTEDVESSGRSLWNPSATVEWNHHKRYLVELGSRGVPVVPTVVPDRETVEDAARRAIASFRVERIVVKPAVASGSEGLAIVDATVPALVEAARRTEAHGGPVFQPFLPSVAEQGELSMIFTRFDDVEFSHAVAKVPKAGDVRVQRTHGGAYRRETPSDALYQASREVLEALPVRWLYARLDWLDWQTEPKLGEVEAIEPHLYWDLAPECAEAFAEKLARQWPE